MEQLKQSRLNNMVMNRERQSGTYETVMTDLYLAGVITKEVCEGLTSRKVNENLKLPNGVPQVNG